MQPYLVQSTTSPDGTVTEHDSTPVRQVISEETSAKVRQILEQVVGDSTEGTGRNAYVAGYRIGGKTGTSTKTTEEIAGNKEYIVSFIGFAPADDPQIALLVLLDNPSSESGIYVSGGQMAAPVVGKMMADILPYLGLEPEYSDSELQTMDRAVPDVMGLSIAEAQSKLAESGLSCRVIGSGGAVTSQLPAANSVIASGSEVLLYADAAPTGGGSVPNLNGMTYSQAREALAAMGLFIGSDSSVTDADNQLVSGQDIRAGTSAKAGTVITVTLYENDEDMLGIY